jgi:RHS repeat-associated protein
MVTDCSGTLETLAAGPSRKPRDQDGIRALSARRYRYTGMERDEETSLEYHTARYCASWLGRWTAADPIGLKAGDSNRFKYCMDSPVEFVDPTGMAPPEAVEIGTGNVIDNIQGSFTDEQLVELQKHDVYVGAVEIEVAPGVLKESQTIVTEAVYELFRDYATTPDFSYETVYAEIGKTTVSFSGGATPTSGEVPVRLNARYAVDLAERFGVTLGDDQLLFPELGKILGIEGAGAPSLAGTLEAHIAETAAVAYETVENIVTIVGAGVVGIKAARDEFLDLLRKRGDDIAERQAANVSSAARAIRSDVVLSGGRTGGKVKGLTGPPNSVVRGGGERLFVTDDQGQVILDITGKRVKPVIPGQGFGPKRAPTTEEKGLLDQVFRLKFRPF